jgi:hypothetical protein
MLTKKDKQAKKKENAEGDDESLNMNVFEKLMESKHTKIVNKSNDDLKSIKETSTFANNDYDKLVYPFSKIIKLKHEPEETQENNPVQYTADIIGEIKNKDGTVVPMRALLDTGTTNEHHLDRRQ